MIDLRSWSAFWQELGARDGGDDLHRRLVACWSEKHRYYHTLQHLRECFEQFDAARADAARPAEIAVAIWFHDAFYEPRRDDNEERSAVWARQAASDAGIAQATAQRLYDLVLATKHDAMPDDPDARVLVDIDLSILGAPDERFDESDVQVRREYAHVPEAEWKIGRKRVLKSFLDRPRLYGTERFYGQLEVQARKNLQRALDRLGD
ncbi:MAG TPA: N-methyl-D-aspartate receptor NMDAR2C subunit [Ramlibacter sp.]|nr:N-methyl-D-aspartate receptor NMDAR2C subunit [Ramlibacter sp.]